MSRSYKKTPYCGQTQRPADKRIANHQVRQKLKNHLDWNIQYNNYKKLSDSWRIRDWGWSYTWEEWYFKQVHLHGCEDDIDDLYEYWQKHYKRK